MGTKFSGSNAAPGIPLQKNLSRKIARFLVSKISPATGVRKNLSKTSKKQSTDTQFAAVKLPKCLEGPHNTYDISTNSSRLQHRSRSNSRNGHSSTHDTREAAPP